MKENGIRDPVPNGSVCIAHNDRLETMGFRIGLKLIGFQQKIKANFRSDHGVDEKENAHIDAAVHHQIEPQHSDMVQRAEYSTDSVQIIRFMNRQCKG